MRSVEELAEDIEVLLPDTPRVEKVELPDCVLLHASDFSFPPAGGAHRLRFDAEGVEERVAAVRAWFRERSRDEFTWWVGTSAMPGDLEARLLAMGAAPYGDDHLLASMVLTEPPPKVEGVEVKRVERFEDFALAREMAWASADFTVEQLTQARSTLESRWNERERIGNAALYLAYVDGEPVACGDMLFLPFGGFLSGAATLPDYRGRGSFRALVRARWDEAVRRGTPALVVSAGKMSRPILERLGFSTAAEQRVLVDRSGLSS